MIGGAPVNQAYADEIGADGYAKDSTHRGGARQGAARRAGERVMAVRARGWEIVERSVPASAWSSTAATAPRSSTRGSATATARSSGTTRIPTWSAASTRATSTRARRSSRPTPSGAPRSSCTSTTSAGPRHGRAHPRAERQGRAAGPGGVSVRAASWPARSGPPATCRSITASARTWPPTRSTSRRSGNKPMPLPRRGGLLRGGDHDVPAGSGRRDPGLQGGGGSAGHGHHVLPVRGAARPRPHHVGRQPGRRGRGSSWTRARTSWA